VQEIAVALIDPNPMQPRQEFDPNALAELAASIKSQGLLQPITVRPSANGRYQLVAGERRLRATQDIGAVTIRVIVREVDDKQLLELALVENIIRSDLNEIEVAEALRELQQRHGYSVHELADAIGRSRPAVSNALRLLELPDTVRALVRNGHLSAGHGRAVLAFPERERTAIAEEALKKQWSVRTLESVARQNPWRKKPARKAVPNIAGAVASVSNLKQAEQQLMDHLATKVSIDPGTASKPGQVAIQFHGVEDLERLMGILLSDANPL
jgi:ParB family chromosome partitioning protein